jgi:hypothetical protein
MAIESELSGGGIHEMSEVTIVVPQGVYLTYMEGR